MKAYLLLITIFASGFVLGYGLRSLLSSSRRARSFARYYRRNRRQERDHDAPLDTYAS